jgi:hypothetical protein
MLFLNRRETLHVEKKQRWGYAHLLRPTYAQANVGHPSPTRTQLDRRHLLFLQPFLEMVIGSLPSYTSM